MSATGSSPWVVGELIPDEGLDLGELTHWELLVLESPPNVAWSLENIEERQAELVDFVRTSLVDRGKVIQESDSQRLAEPERVALSARDSCSGGITVRGPAPSDAIAFEVHVGDSFTLTDEHTEEHIKFGVQRSDAWAEWLCRRLETVAEPSYRIGDVFTPVFLVRCFERDGGTVSAVEVILGKTADGIAVAVEDNDEREVFEVESPDLIAFVQSLGGLKN